MSNEVLIKVDNVSKKFCRDLKRSLWYGVKDMSSDLFRGGANEDDTLRKGEFWANEGISFEVKRGECLGLIGHNGAGKTTLLKMLNGLIKPDTGRIEMRGRVGALIALGAGFNPILTGRENIYINGSILGLSRRAIDAKIEEIIDFAEIESALDAPVRTYSSGMQVRLGFAVATVLIQPDVLLLDEVIAVGDAGFRSKAYNQILSLAKKTAVICVSHSMQQIARLSSSILLLDGGKVDHFSTEVGASLDRYHSKYSAMEVTAPEFIKPGKLVLESIVSESGTVTGMACGKRLLEGYCGKQFTFSLRFNLAQPMRGMITTIVLYDRGQIPVTTVRSPHIDLAAGTATINIEIASLALSPGPYTAAIVVAEDAEHTGAFEHTARYDGAFELRVKAPDRSFHTLTSLTYLASSWRSSDEG